MKRIVVFLVMAMLAMPLRGALASNQNGIGVGAYEGMHPAVTIKARALSVTPLELQYSYIFGAGQEANINLYLLHTKWFKLHLIDPGVFMGKTMSGVDIGQQYDISAGGGIEATVWRRLVVFANVRVYLPDPGSASKIIDNQTKTSGESTATQTNNPNQIYDSAKNAAYSSVSDIYGKALNHYQISFGVMWFLW
ncbi:MAG: hypothetical protein M1334_02135 [Patescibacteria group bacterium]|nr:hypothetical protein [Patescibacteria group bacterium]